MSVDVLQGCMGSGKSAVAVARAIMHLKKGGVVAANFSLVDGWAESVAGQSLIGRFSPTYKLKRASSLHQRFFRVDSLPAIRKIKPKELAVDIYKQKEGAYSEGEGLLLLDESQLIFNSRNSMTGSKNLDWIQFFTQSRKLGWNVILIAHTIDMIDSQIRPLAEYESRFRNLQRVKIPVLGLPLCPFPMFLVIQRYAGLGPGASAISHKGLFPLPLWAAKLYDSLLVFDATHWGADTDPHLCGPAPSAVQSVDVPRPGRCAALIGPHWDSYMQTLPGSDPILLTEIA